MRIVRSVTLLCATAFLAYAQRGANNLPSLKSVPVPQPTGIATYVKDQAALVALGKALFWDFQVGSDGRTACATCHFHAGADHRSQNQLAPAGNSMASVILNQSLAAVGFPFHQLSNPANNRSSVVSDTRQVSGSAGIIHRTFSDVIAGSALDDGADDPADTTFAVGGIKLRQVTTRNAPSVINAVFNVRNFWDGRARTTFTGATPFGASDTTPNAVAFVNGELQFQAVAIGNSSLASQAVGPPVNSGEMAYDGRTWPRLGRKMLSLNPLSRQQVAPDDSVLGAMANVGGNGLIPQVTYASMIQAAFQPQWWSGDGIVTINGSPFNQSEANFSIFFGLAIQAYESTLVSDNTRVDQFQEGNRAALTALEQAGLNAFLDGGSQCTQCHQGAEFTAASFTNSARNQGSNNPDNIGFFRTGVSPIKEDIGLGALDGFGLPLFAANTAAAAGVFKSPGLRNVEFTGPYFHNGGQATLEQVLSFYARNGDFPAEGNLGPGIGRINLSAAEQTSIVAFLKALSDDRVKYEQAPFDHPSLCVPNGAAEASPGVPLPDTSDARFAFTAVDKFALVEAVGKSGNGVPLQTFQELLAGIGSDGTRAHALTTSCEP